MQRILKAIKREWELSVLVVMILIGLVGLVSGSVKAIGFWGGDEEPPVPRVNVKPRFSNSAFAYLKPAPAHQVGSSHAMKLQMPKEWLNKKRYEKMLADRERMRREAELRRKGQIDHMANLLANDKTTTKSDKTTKPNPPITHFLVFKGYMESPKGEVLAYLGKEDAQEDVVKRTGSTFLRVGGRYKGHTVKQINDDWLLLTNPDGTNLTIIRGQRHKYGITENPDYLLEPDEPKTDDEAASGTAAAKKPRNPKAGTSGKPRSKRSPQDMLQEYLKKNKGKAGQDMIQDYLKKNKGKINEDTIRDLMKKNSIKHKDVERLFR